MKSTIYRLTYKLADRFHWERLRDWAYIRWFRSAMDSAEDPNEAYFKFAYEFLGLNSQRNSSVRETSDLNRV